jgi:hypothetical protein
MRLKRRKPKVFLKVGDVLRIFDPTQVFNWTTNESIIRIVTSVSKKMQDFTVFPSYCYGLGTTNFVQFTLPTTDDSQQTAVYLGSEMGFTSNSTYTNPTFEQLRQQWSTSTSRYAATVNSLVSKLLEAHGKPTDPVQELINKAV